MSANFEAQQPPINGEPPTGYVVDASMAANYSVAPDAVGVRAVAADCRTYTDSNLQAVSPEALQVALAAYGVVEAGLIAGAVVTGDKRLRNAALVGAVPGALMLAGCGPKVGTGQEQPLLPVATATINLTENVMSTDQALVASYKALFLENSFVQKNQLQLQDSWLVKAGEAQKDQFQFVMVWAKMPTSDGSSVDVFLVQYAANQQKPMDNVQTVPILPIEVGKNNDGSFCLRMLIPTKDGHTAEIMRDDFSQLVIDDEGNIDFEKSMQFWLKTTITNPTDGNDGAIAQTSLWDLLTGVKIAFAKEQEASPSVTPSRSPKPATPSPSPSPSPPKPTSTPEWQVPVLTDLPLKPGVMFYGLDGKEKGELRLAGNFTILDEVTIDGIKYVKIKNTIGTESLVLRFVVEDILKPKPTIQATAKVTVRSTPRVIGGTPRPIDQTPSSSPPTAVVNNEPPQPTTIRPEPVATTPAGEGVLPEGTDNLGAYGVPKEKSGTNAGATSFTIDYYPALQGICTNQAGLTEQANNLLVASTTIRSFDPDTKMPVVDGNLNFKIDENTQFFAFLPGGTSIVPIPRPTTGAVFGKLIYVVLKQPACQPEKEALAGWSLFYDKMVSWWQQNQNGASSPGIIIDRRGK